MNLALEAKLSVSSRLASCKVNIVYIVKINGNKNINFRLGLGIRVNSVLKIVLLYGCAC